MLRNRLPVGIQRRTVLRACVSTTNLSLKYTSQVAKFHAVQDVRISPLPYTQALHGPLRSASSARPTVVRTRLLSTNRPEANAAKDVEQTPPLNNTSSKSKPKVELRPAPIKPSKPSPNETSIRAATRTPSEGTLLNKTGSDTPKVPSPPSPFTEGSRFPNASTNALDENTSVVETAKRDVEDATKHGILSPPPPDAGVVKRFLHQAWQLFKFYLAGIKLIVANGKEVKSIQARVRDGGIALSWKEHRFIKTHKSDLTKLVPFVLTLVVLEEVIPLIVLYAPGMLPSTCILPSQRERIEKKRHDKQRQSFTYARLADLFKDADASAVQLRSLSEEHVNVLCSTVGISSSGIFGMQRRRLAKYLRSVADEDTLLLSEGKGAQLKPDELSQTLWERGFSVDQLTHSQQLKRLSWWLDNVGTASDTSQEDARTRALVQMHVEAARL